MTSDQERLAALEEMAAITGHGINVPWLDLQILRLVDEARKYPNKRNELFRAALLLGEGRSRLIAQHQASPAPPVSTTPPTAQIDQMEILRRNTLLLDRYEREVGIAKSYTTVISGAGYAGLLAIWSGFRDHIGKAPLLYSGALIGFSLIVFVVWEMVKSRLVQIGSAEFERVVHEKFYSPDFEVAAAAGQAVHIGKVSATNRFQPFVFWASTITGLGAAAILICAAVVTATGLQVSFNP